MSLVVQRNRCLVFASLPLNAMQLVYHGAFVDESRRAAGKQNFFSQKSRRKVNVKLLTETSIIKITHGAKPNEPVKSV